MNERDWLPENVTGATFETQPFLSAFLRIHSFEDRETIFQQFSNAGISLQQRADMAATIASLQTQVRAFQQSVHAIVLALLRERSSREATLRYLRTALTCNVARAQLGSQLAGRGQSGCSHGFMMNVAALLLALTTPYTSNAPSLDSLLLAYPLFNSTTRVLMSDAEFNEWRAAQSSIDKLHFVSESFALAHGALRICVGPAVKLYFEFQRTMNQVYQSAGVDHPHFRQLLQAKCSYVEQDKIPHLTINSLGWMFIFLMKCSLLL